VAGSPVALWAQICRLNQEQILSALQAFREELIRLEGALKDGDRFDAMLESARQTRIRLGLSGPGATGNTVSRNT